MSQLASSNAERASALSRRLSALQNDTEHPHRLDEVQQRIQVLEQAVNTAVKSQNEAVLALQAQTTELQQRFEEETAHTETRFRACTQQLGQIQQNLQEALRQLANQRRDTDLLLQQLLETAVVRTRGSVRQATSRLASAIDEARTRGDTQFPGLEEQVRGLGHEMETLTDTVSVRLNKVLQELRQEVFSDQRAQEETRTALHSLAQDAVSRLRTELSQERRERKQTEDALLRLLEETCDKLNTLSNS